jgi:hypothetical protein
MIKVMVLSEGSNWVIIPEDKYEEFNQCAANVSMAEMYSEKWYDLIDVFETKYGGYRTGGDINNVQLYAEI